MYHHEHILYDIANNINNKFGTTFITNYKLASL